MKKTNFEGLYSLTNHSFIDNRGTLLKFFDEKAFFKNGIDFSVKQTFLSNNTYKHTWRGLHAQMDETKLVSIISGATHTVLVDIRPQSKTYKEKIYFQLKANDALLIPSNVLHGYLTLEDNTTLMYHTDRPYEMSEELFYNYKDPLFAIELPIGDNELIISEKDKMDKNYLL